MDGKAKQKYYVPDGMDYFVNFIWNFCIIFGAVVTTPYVLGHKFSFNGVTWGCYLCVSPCISFLLLPIFQYVDLTGNIEINFCCTLMLIY